MSKKFIEVSNCWNLGGRTEVDGREIFKAKKEESYYTILENGIFLKGYGDGRFEDEDTGEEYARVYLNEYDDDGELEQGELIGYCKV